MEDAQVPDSDLVKEHFPNDSGGFLYKMQPWFELAPFLSGYTIGLDNESWCNLMPTPRPAASKKRRAIARIMKSAARPIPYSDFTNVFSLIDAANSSGTPNYVANMENIANMENWMRVFAANHAAGNWDSFGAQNEQNLYGYIGTLGTKYSLVDVGLQHRLLATGRLRSWGPGQNLFYCQSV